MEPSIEHETLCLENNIKAWNYVVPLSDALLFLSTQVLHCYEVYFGLSIRSECHPLFINKLEAKEVNVEEKTFEDEEMIAREVDSQARNCGISKLIAGI